MNTMHMFENYRRESKLLSAGIASIITSLLIEKYAILFKSNTLAYVTIVVFVIIIILIINTALDAIIDNSLWLRRKIMGKNFIEGYWYDISIDEVNRTIKHGVLIKIDYENGSYTMNGITYNMYGERIATWKSISCTFFEKVLFVQYESHTKYSATFMEHGVLQIQFESPANSYNGFYFDFSNSIRFIITGHKVPKDKVDAYNRFQNTHDKEKFIIEVLENEDISLKNRVLKG